MAGNNIKPIKNMQHWAKITHWSENMKHDFDGPSAGCCVHLFRFLNPELQDVAFKKIKAEMDSREGES